MKNRSVRPIVCIGAMLVLIASVAQAQGRGPRQGSPRYDTASVITVSGMVENVTHQTGGTGWSGTHFTLKATNGTWDVHLGPSAFLERQGLKLGNGEQVEVTGSKIHSNGSDALLAREVKIGGKTYELRDQNGYPKWSRRSSRQ